MPRKTEQHIIDAVMKEFEEGTSIRDIVKRYDISESTARRLESKFIGSLSLAKNAPSTDKSTSKKKVKTSLNKLPEIKATKEEEKAISKALKDVKAGRTKTIDPSKPISEQLLGVEYILKDALFIKQEYSFVYAVRESISIIQVFFLFAHLLGLAPNDYFLLAATILFVPQIVIALFLKSTGVKKLYVESSDAKTGTFSLK